MTTLFQILTFVLAMMPLSEFPKHEIPSVPGDMPQYCNRRSRSIVSVIRTMFTMSLIFAIQYIVETWPQHQIILDHMHHDCSKPHAVFMGCLGMQSATYVFNTVCIIGVLYAMQYVELHAIIP
jgi:hypothetical protein